MIEELKLGSQIRLYISEIDILRTQINNELITKEKGKETSIFSENEINKYLSTPLSLREIEVLKELSKGKTNKQISADLHVSVNTIKSHLLSIYTKLDVKNRTQAVSKISNLPSSSLQKKLCFPLLLSTFHPYGWLLSH